MVIFGGIYDVTKELDDMSMYDLEKRRWTQLIEDHAMISTVQKKLNFNKNQEDGSQEGGPGGLTTQSDIGNSSFNNSTFLSNKLNMTSGG